MEINAVQTKKTRKDYLDYAKAIGIFLVVWGHLLMWQTNPLLIAVEIRAMIYSFHMPLFFIVSGIGLWYKLENSGKIILRKEYAAMAKKLLTPYLFWCIVYISIEMVISPSGERMEEFVSYAGRALFGRIAPLWFLHTLFMAEAAFLWLWNIFKRKGKEKSIFEWGGVLLILTAVTVTLDGVYKYFKLADILARVNGANAIVVMVFRFFPALFFVCAGYTMFIAWRKLLTALKRQTLIIVSAISFVALYALFLMFKSNVNMFIFNMGKNAVIFLVTGISGSIIVLLLCTLLPKGLRLLSAVGKESLHIMALHYPPMPIYIIMLWLSDKFIGSSLTILASLATTAACYFTAVYIFEPICGILKRAFDNKFRRNL